MKEFWGGAATLRPLFFDGDTEGDTHGDTVSPCALRGRPYHSDQELRIAAHHQQVASPTLFANAMSRGSTRILR
jgi:hypothetical protein